MQIDRPAYIQDILRLRLERGLTQEQLDDIIGVADGYTAKLESLARNPTLQMLIFYARGLNAQVRLMQDQEHITIPDFEDDMARSKSFSRNKGTRIENEIVQHLTDEGVEASRVLASGAFGRFDKNLAHDLRVEGLTAEVKARANGKGFATLEQWIGDAELLFLRRDRQKPMVTMNWETFVALAKAYGDSKCQAVTPYTSDQTSSLNTDPATTDSEPSSPAPSSAASSKTSCSTAL